MKYMLLCLYFDRGDPERFIDPSSIRLKITAQLRNGDGSQLEPNTNCAPIANLAGSLFSKVIVTLGNTTQITESMISIHTWPTWNMF